MNIIQLSDFHFNEKMQYGECKTKIDKLFESVELHCSKTEKLIFCVCGDISDQGNVIGYQCAKQTFDYLVNKFNDYNCVYEFVPGNHDLDLVNKNFNEFDKFIEDYVDGDKYKYQEKGIFLREHDNICFVLMNTAFHLDSTYGKVTLDEFEQILQKCDKPLIVIAHHTIISEYDDDISAIRNGYGFIKCLEKYDKVLALLHGHTHGYSNIVVSIDCRIIGVGPMFKQIEDVNTQFNLIRIFADEINKIDNFRYSADLTKYHDVNLFKRQAINTFYGTKTSVVYQDAVFTTRAFEFINNFNMNIVMDCESFFCDMENKFADDIVTAKDWQNLELPDRLYYNHGQFMKYNDIDAIDYIIKELQNKATSGRAIVPLICLEDVMKSGDGFLPSLDIIQFGFNGEGKRELYITIYLRALEVNHFLRINLAEIYLMVKRLKREIRSINNLNITVFAFKAQYKSNFGCFRKAKIDMMAERQVTRLVDSKKINEIIDLLHEKLQLSETVVHVDGLILLYNCIKDVETEDFYSASLVSDIQKLIEFMQALKTEREKTSNYRQIEIIEGLASDQMMSVIKSFETLYEKGK